MTYLILFLTFFLIGAFTFGGGYAMLPLIADAVSKNGWVSDSEVLDFIAVSESTPGPFAINMATFVGIKTAGLPGAVCSTLGVVLPSFVIILIVARFYEKYKTNGIVSGAMSGLRPAVIGLIGSAILTSSKTVFFPDGFPPLSGLAATVFSVPFLMSLAVFVLCLILALKKKSPILIIIVSAAVGIAVGYASELIK